MSQADRSRRSDPAPERVGIVIAGAGARGAYEAGVLSVVLPRLAAAGARPRVFVGTSAGAINATLLAAGAHLSPEDQTAALLDVWRRIGPRDVFAPLLTSTPRTAATWLAQRLGVDGVRLFGLVDTAPLARTADAVVDWSRLRGNVDGGTCQALAVVATSGRSGRSVVFTDLPADASVPPDDQDRAVDYVATQIGSSHVRASAAIPVVFPPVEVTEPPQRAGWYLDGGVRLNAPLKPALDLGCDALVVVATHPDNYAVDAGAPHHERPDVDDALVMLLDAAFGDRMVEDLRTLTKVNELVAAGGAGTDSGRRSVVPHLFCGPPERATLSKLAAEVYEARFTSLRGKFRALREPDLPLLAQILGGDGPRRGDVLSYLLFDREFIARAVALGQQHASALFAGMHATQVPWRTTPREDRSGPSSPPDEESGDAGEGDERPVPPPRSAPAGAPSRPGGVL